jgi:hypothetical protein
MYIYLYVKFLNLSASSKAIISQQVIHIPHSSFIHVTKKIAKLENARLKKKKKKKKKPAGLVIPLHVQSSILLLFCTL